MPTEVYGGQLNPAVITEKMPTNKVVLHTYYPLDEDYKIGHSSILAHGRYSFKQDTQASDPGYNLICNNCSNDTMRVIESLAQKRAKPRLITTPGTTRDYVKELWGDTKGYKERYDKFGRITSQEFNVPLYQLKHVRDSLSKYKEGGTIDYSTFGKQYESNFKYIDDRLKSAGYNDIQRLAILGNIQRESSGNPLAISKNGKWHGIIQWDENRYRIKSSNPKEELKRQTDYLIKELEKTGWSGATWKDQVSKSNSFKQTTDLKKAVDIFTRHFVRPGNIESEINKRFDFANSARIITSDPEYDLDTARKVLPKQEIEAWDNNPEENHLPTGYTDEQGKYHYLKSSQHESYPLSREFERTDPDTIKAMSVYGNADDYVSKFPVYSPITSGTPKSLINFEPYNTQNLVYRPMVIKRQYGGNLIYQQLNKSTPLYKQEKLDYWDFDLNEDKFPIESVVLYNPREITETTVQEEPASQAIYETSTQPPVQSVIEQPAPLIPKGIIEYKTPGIDIGNMKELVELMRDEGISFRITSGNRPGAKTKSGKMSNHSTGNALDITPIRGQSWDDLINQMKKSKRFLAYMREHKLGILDERSQKMLAKTGGTGAHFHIGPDLQAISNFNLMFR